MYLTPLYLLTLLSQHRALCSFPISSPQGTWGFRAFVSFLRIFSYIYPLHVHFVLLPTLRTELLDAWYAPIILPLLLVPWFYLILALYFINMTFPTQVISDANQLACEKLRINFCSHRAWSKLRHPFHNRRASLIS